MSQATLLSKFHERLLAIGHGTRVTPDNGITKRFLVLIHAHETMHLIRDTYGTDILTTDTCVVHCLRKSLLGILPP